MSITTNRAEAFSDGVIAIVMTIMVFDIKLPDSIRHLSNKRELKELIVLAPQLVAYLFSFAVLGVMWLNHHHLFHLVHRVDERFLWLNMHLLFWLSLIPFPTDMLGLAPFLSYSATIYGIVLFMAAFAFMLLRSYAMRHGFMYPANSDEQLKQVIDKVNRRARMKNYIGMAAYLCSIPASFWSVYLSYACFAVAPVLFFIPDRLNDEQMAMIENELTKNNNVQQ